MYEIAYGPLDIIRKMGYYSRENEEVMGNIYLRSHREQTFFAFLDISENNWDQIVLVKTAIENGEEIPEKTQVYKFSNAGDDFYEITGFIYDTSVIVKWYPIDADENLVRLFHGIIERERH